MFAPLRQRNFALLWTGGLVSIAGDRVLRTILPFYVYQQSHSTLATAVMVSCELLPRLLLGSLAGVLVDRWDRRRVMLAATGLQALALLPLLLLPATGRLWIVYLVGLLQSSISLFFGPAENALLPRLVSEELLLPANALNSLNNNLGRLAGPPLGGVVYALGGLPAVVLLDALTFLFAGLMILFVQPPAPDVQPEDAGEARTRPTERAAAAFWAEWREGLRVIRESRVLTRLVCLTLLLNLGGVMMDPLYVPFISDIVQVGPQTYGWILTVRGVGGIVGSLIAGRLGHRLRREGQVFGHAEIVLGLLLLLMFNLPLLPVVGIAMFGTGIPGVIGSVALDTLFQRVTPNAYMGRVFGLLDTGMSVLSLIGVIGLGGFLSSTVGITPVLNLAAIITLGTGLLALMVLPEGGRVRDRAPA
jgi:predicted MFS family arabinose efflux permease